MSHPGAIACSGTLERSRTQNSHTALYSIDEKNSSKAGGLLWGANMGESTSNRFGVFRAVVLLAYGSLAACSASPAEPAPVSVFPIDRITGAVTSGANRPVMADSKPAADRGELRFVAVPPGQVVGGMIHARQISSRTAIASDRAVHPKKQKAHAEKVSPPVTTVDDASAKIIPVN